MRRLVPGCEPIGLWNTHVDALATVAKALDQGFDAAMVAGITGLAFRTALCRDAAPLSAYATWDHASYLQRWLQDLGVDADAFQLNGPEYAGGDWLQRRLAETTLALNNGLPVVCFDNFGFGLITGYDDESRALRVTGIPRKVVHPVWEEHPDAGPLLQRAYTDRGQRADGHWLDRDELTASLSGITSFCIPYRVVRSNPERAALRGLQSCCLELAGLISHPVVGDDLQLSTEPQFGPQALQRLQQELDQRSVNHFGMVLAMNMLSEARSLGANFLRQCGPILPEFGPRLEQAAEFTTRTCNSWRRLAGMWGLPLERSVQLHASRLEESKQLLHGILQTERTIGRLLNSIAAESA